MTTPKISVLMPAYNAEKYIGEAIESILNQTFKDFEFIIVDDCSTDKTWEIIQRFAIIDTRIVALKNKINLGIAGNRNKLISLASGKYVLWQDADDISMRYRAEKQYDFMVNHQDVGICGGWLQFFSESKDLGIRKYDSEDANLRKKIFRYSPVAQPGAMIRRDVFKKVGEFDLKYPPAEDLDMSFRIGTFYKFSNLQEVVLKYRSHDSSATFKRLRKIEVSTLKIRWNNLKNKSYNLTIIDFVYNLVQIVSMVLPPKIKIFIFNTLRNSK